MTLCACGCQRPVLSKRARYYSARCRAKASRARSGAGVLSAREVKVLLKAAGELGPFSALGQELEAIAARADQMRLALRSEAHVRISSGDVAIRQQ